MSDSFIADFDRAVRSLQRFSVQCTCDWERFVSNDSCPACTDVPCVTCSDGHGKYASELGPVCLQCFIAPGPSLLELAVMEAIDDLVEMTPSAEIPQRLRDDLDGTIRVHVD